MYIINTTYVIEPPIHGQWYDIFTTKYVPFLRSAGFEKMVMTRVLSEDKVSHYTYSLQVEVDDIATYQRFMSDAMGEYNQIATPLFGESALHFCTLLKKIDL